MEHEGDDTTARWELPLDEHPALEVTAEMAQIALVPTLVGEKAFVEVFNPDKVTVHVRTSPGITHVHLEQDVGFFGFGRSKAHIVLHVPANVRASVRTEAGRLRAERLHGCQLVLETEAGEVLLDDVQGSMRVVTEAGKIVGEKLGGALDFATSAGAIFLEILALDPGKHRVVTSVGAVKLELARGLLVRIDARTTMGTSRVQFPSHREAPAILEVDAEIGAIKVRESTRLGIALDAHEGVPYRSARAAAPIDVAAHDDTQLEAILRRVADGSLSPKDAGSLLRALGHG
jgi:hypothetical protein